MRVFVMRMRTGNPETVEKAFYAVRTRPTTEKAKNRRCHVGATIRFFTDRSLSL